MNHVIPDIIGIIGVVLMLSAYFLLQIGKIPSTSFSYSFLNLVAASMILFSLWFDWNLPSVTIEACWALISAYGVGKYFRSKRLQAKPSETSLQTDRT
uniref:CBU-0592-like domain-containing protein n=1 Tax=Candidatus Kentrum sp. TUN TaxID=2126343 RepID=A0A450ZZ21_9GAMM|nr:MAG: hypothetical protein BECKTUN1418D_GA0071000_10938 [Candidatus Kentron sp. TUN]